MFLSWVPSVLVHHLSNHASVIDDVQQFMSSSWVDSCCSALEPLCSEATQLSTSTSPCSKDDPDVPRPFFHPSLVVRGGKQGMIAEGDDVD